MQWSRYYEIEPHSRKYIYIPTQESRELGKQIIKTIRNQWNPPNYFYHMKKGGHLSAIKAHTQYSNLHPRFSIFDISGFFGQVTRNKTLRVLKHFVPYETAEKWAYLSTVKKPFDHQRTLPYGFLQSGDIASLALDRSYLGNEFRKISQEKNIKISVFVDDIILSSPDSDLLSFHSDNLLVAAKKSNFALKQEKTICNVDEIDVFNIHCNQDLSLDFLIPKFENFEKTLVNYSSDPRVVFGIVDYMLKVNSNSTFIFLEYLLKKGIFPQGHFLNRFVQNKNLNPSINLRDLLKNCCFSKKQEDELPF